MREQGNTSSHGAPICSNDFRADFSSRMAMGASTSAATRPRTGTLPRRPTAQADRVAGPSRRSGPQPPRSCRPRGSRQSSGARSARIGSRRRAALARAGQHLEQGSRARHVAPRRLQQALRVGSDRGQDRLSGDHRRARRLATSSAARGSPRRPRRIARCASACARQKRGASISDLVSLRSASSQRPRRTASSPSNALSRMIMLSSPYRSARSRSLSRRRWASSNAPRHQRSCAKAISGT